MYEPKELNASYGPTKLSASYDVKQPTTADLQKIRNSQFTIRFLLAIPLIAGAAIFLQQLATKRQSVVEQWERRENTDVWIKTDDKTVMSLTTTGITDGQLLNMNDFKDEIQWLELSDTTITDEGMTTINTFSKLYSLTIDQSQITDGGLQRLTSTPELQIIFLSSSSVTGTGFERLKNNGLLSIGLNNSPLSHDGLATITNIPTVSALHLAECALKDEDLKDIAKLSNLKTLDLSKNKITGNGLRHLHGLPIEFLYVKECNLTDDDLPIIASLFPNLRYLHLDGNQISFDGLKPIDVLPLQELSVKGTLVDPRDSRLTAFIKRDRANKPIATRNN